MARTLAWLSHIARIRCKRELYRPSHTPETACRALGGSPGRHVDVTKAVRRISTTTRGYLQLWAMK